MPRVLHVGLRGECWAMVASTGHITDLELSYSALGVGDGRPMTFERCSACLARLVHWICPRPLLRVDLLLRISTSVDTE